MLLQHKGGCVVSRSAPLKRRPTGPVRPLKGRTRSNIVTMASKAPSPPELTGFWSTLIAEQLTAFPGLDPGVSYLISHGVGHLVVPILEAWVIVWFMQFIARKMHDWCEANPERPMLTEVVQLLPGAIKGPTVVTLCILVTLRLVHNAAFLLANYMFTFQQVTYSKAADALVTNLCASLRPMGQSLVKVYSVIMLFYLCTVLVKWKSLGLSSILEREREQQEALIAASGGVSNKSRSMDDLERVLVPFDAATSWLMYAIGFVAAAQIIGLDIAPLVAVGGAGGIIIGLATQQLLTNAFMGLSLFFTRPFVDGDSVLVQAAGGLVVSGVVEKTTVMRTTLRTEDDVVVTIPNKTVADMIVFNRSAEVRRSRLASVNRQTENIKLRLKLPYAQEGRLRELQETVKSVLEPPAGSKSFSGLQSGSPSDADAEGSMDETSGTPALAAGSGAAAAGGRLDSPLGAALKSLGKRRGAVGTPAGGVSAVRPSHPVVANSVEVVISKFTDVGVELLVKAKLRVEPSNSMVQSLLLDLSSKVRQLGGMMVNV